VGDDGAEMLVGEDPPQQFTRAYWDDVAEHIADWVGEVKDYQDTPDLWVEFTRTREVLANAQYEVSDNTPFMPAE
jgi:hypothetical protein